jgi:hypothetical protein
MKSLMAGFDAISNHIGLILFSVILDIILWFGPHLGLVHLVESAFARLFSLPDMQAPEMGDMLQLSRDLWLSMAERFNLVSLLRSFPIGIPSLMASRSPLTAPLGVPLQVEIPSASLTFGLGLILFSVGVVVGTLYFSVVAQAALNGKIIWKQAINNWPWESLQVLLLTGFGLILLLTLLIPFSCFLSILLISGIGLEQFSLLVVLIFAGLMIWWLLPLIFAPHGIFINHYAMWKSVKKGINITKMTLPTTSLLLLIIIILSEGLKLLWRVPAETSWFAFVGVVGHAFVTASLLATSFIYYRDADHWLRGMNQQDEAPSENKKIN